MNVNELATVLMGDISWINSCLIVIAVICIAGFAIMLVKYELLIKHIDGLEDIVDDLRYKVDKL